MNILDDWKLIDKNENRTSAMKEHSKAIIEFLEANPDVVEMYEKWIKMSKEEQEKLTEEYQKIYFSMPVSTPDEAAARALFYDKNFFIIRP
jgi:ABC-type nitrate/sulfonate/bicarbonate transport system substrate-binding protein